MRFNLPSVAYDPIVNDNWTEIMYYPSDNANHPATKTVKLPPWLSLQILRALDRTAKQAKVEALAPIQKALGI